MKRKSISKAMRQKVLDKYGGHCAYCGKVLDLKTLRVDHLHPHYRGGEDSFENYMPAVYLKGLSEGYAWTGYEEIIGNVYENKEF